MGVFLTKLFSYWPGDIKGLNGNKDLYCLIRGDFAVLSLLPTVFLRKALNPVITTTRKTCDSEERRESAHSNRCLNHLDGSTRACRWSACTVVFGDTKVHARCQGQLPRHCDQGARYPSAGCAGPFHQGNNESPWTLT